MKHRKIKEAVNDEMKRFGKYVELYEHVKSKLSMYGVDLDTNEDMGEMLDHLIKRDRESVLDPAASISARGLIWHGRHIERFMMHAQAWAEEVKRGQYVIRKVDAYGKPLDGKPIEAGDVLLTLRGYYTSRYPGEESGMDMWLMSNAYMDIITKQDDHSLFGIYKFEDITEGRPLTLESREALTTYIFSEPGVDFELVIDDSDVAVYLVADEIVRINEIENHTERVSGKDWLQNILAGKLGRD